MVSLKEILEAVSTFDSLDLSPKYMINCLTHDLPSIYYSRNLGSLYRYGSLCPMKYIYQKCVSGTINIFTNIINNTYLGNTKLWRISQIIFRYRKFVFICTFTNLLIIFLFLAPFWLFTTSSLLCKMYSIFLKPVFSSQFQNSEGSFWK